MSTHRVSCWLASQRVGSSFQNLPICRTPNTSFSTSTRLPIMNGRSKFWRHSTESRSDRFISYLLFDIFICHLNALSHWERVGEGLAKPKVFSFFASCSLLRTSPYPALPEANE